MRLHTLILSALLTALLASSPASAEAGERAKPMSKSEAKALWFHTVCAYDENQEYYSAEMESVYTVDEAADWARFLARKASRAMDKLDRPVWPKQYRKLADRYVVAGRKVARAIAAVGRAKTVPAYNRAMRAAGPAARKAREAAKPLKKRLRKVEGTTPMPGFLTCEEAGYTLNWDDDSYYRDNIATFQMVR